MKRRLITGSIFILLIGFMACQKYDKGSNGSYSANLYTSVAEIIGTQITSVTSANEHSLSVEKYNGTSAAYVISGNPSGYPGLPGWGLPGVGHLKFGVPHVDSCAVVTVNSNTYPKEIVIEYLKGCSTHKHDKWGKVIITLTDTITSAGAIQTLTYQDFHIDSIEVGLTATLKNLGKNEDGNWIIEKKYKQTITKGDEVCVRENSETAEWIAGFETTDKSDDEYYLSGSGSVVINDTATYTKIIITPLHFSAGCEFITSGVVELDRNGDVVTIDYGDGTCDDKATVTSNGVTEEINLHSNRFRGEGHHGKHFHRFGDNSGGGRGDN